jgi:hypothetical protein
MVGCQGIGGGREPDDAGQEDASAAQGIPEEGPRPRVDGGPGGHAHHRQGALQGIRRPAARQIGRPHAPHAVRGRPGEEVLGGEHLDDGGEPRPGVADHGCHKRRFWRKITVRTADIRGRRPDVRPRPRLSRGRGFIRG